MHYHWCIYDSSGTASEVWRRCDSNTLYPAMKVLAIDQGRKWGWAVSVDGELYACGGDTIPKERGLLNFYHNVKNLVDLYCPDVVRLEMPNRHYNALISGASYNAVARLWCEYKDIPVELRAATTIKKQATGSGRATKEEMLDFARNHGYDGDDDNVADAIAHSLIKDTDEE